LKEAVLFLKKGPKNSCSSAFQRRRSHSNVTRRTQRQKQKFFGPFFQKRTASLSSQEFSMTRITPLLAALFLASAAAAQTVDGARPGNMVGTGMSLPRSDTASNIGAQDTRSELAPNLPAPSATDDIQTLLLDARHALQTGQTGAAQEALERAETRVLDRSVPQGEERVLAEDPLTAATGQARAALAAGDIQGAIRVIDAALPRAADADIPR
jgi:hypothetical protein